MSVEFVTPERPVPRVFAFVPAAILVVATLSLHVPYFLLSPGPAEDIPPLVHVEGAETHPVNGRLLLTTVSLREAHNLVETIRALALGSVDLVHRDRIIPPGRTDEEVDRVNEQAMERSQLVAAAAALMYLGYDVDISGAGARVVQVQEDAPAAAVLRPGDVIVAADAQPVAESQDLVDRVDGRGVGEEIALRLVRDGEEIEVAVRTIPRPDEPERPMIGVMIETLPGDVDLPISIRIDAGRIGGPSAGLMFALTLVDLLEPDDLLSGRTVAGTGVIGLRGEVTPVGGIVQKVTAARREGADLFMVPAALLPMACSVAGDMPVVAVEELADAVEALRDPVASGGSCP